jgi:molybdopterin-guanine dinucleotide biosynthesis protein A
MMGSVKRKIRCDGEAMTAIVLAGGRGRRMKADKAGLAVGDRTLLEHVLSQLEPNFEEILVSVSPGQTIGLEAGYEAGTRFRGKRTAIRQSLKPRVIEDETPGLGPLGGILSGLKAAANDACAVVACDIPDIDIPLLRSLARAADEADIAVPVGPAGHFEPLFAVYRKPVVPEIEALLRSGERSILPLFGRCRTVVVRLKDATWLRNLNTREDYRSYLRSLTGRQPGRTEEGPRVIGRINRKKTDSALSKKR